MLLNDTTTSRLHLIRHMADQAFSRSAGAPLVGGNHIELLFDSTQNFPAWESAITQAQHHIFIEMYIFSNGGFGRHLRDLLIKKATEGIAVYLLYDWFGSCREHYFGFFKPLQKAGVHVRVFNKPSTNRILQLLQRDHRKLIIIDGHTAFVSGLCISSLWEGHTSGSTKVWRDTGTKLMGPIVADAIAAFADSWSRCGAPLTENLKNIQPMPCGSVQARLIATTPDTVSMMRLDVLIASIARHTLWITDAYFMGSGLYISALKHAARDGVDVRILVPRSSDIGWIATISRTLYRPLIESGVRVFEWNGAMMHAKTAVADFRWSRIGSTNLNLFSWLANRELDVSIEDELLSTELATRFLDDLNNATEIVLSESNHRLNLALPRRHEAPSFMPLRGRSVASANAVARQIARVKDVLGVVASDTRAVESSEAPSFLWIGLSLCLLAMLIGWFPRFIAWPLAVLIGISGLATTVRSIMLYRERGHRRSSK